MILLDPTTLATNNGHIAPIFLFSMFTYRITRDINTRRMYLPVQKSYPLISTLFKIVKNDFIPTYNLRCEYMDGFMDDIEQWLYDNEPQINYIKSVKKYE